MKKEVHRMISFMGIIMIVSSSFNLLIFSCLFAEYVRDCNQLIAQVCFMQPPFQPLILSHSIVMNMNKPSNPYQRKTPYLVIFENL